MKLTSLAVHLGVDGGGIVAAVAQHLGDFVEGAPGVQHLGGSGMAQPMRIGSRQTRSFERGTRDHRDRAGLQRSKGGPHAEKELADGRSWPALAQIRRDGLADVSGER
jgi:hypothetical protein